MKATGAVPGREGNRSRRGKQHGMVVMVELQALFEDGKRVLGKRIFLTIHMRNQSHFVYM